MRGEHICDKGGKVLSQGSSPHARGAQVVAELVLVVPGIIPACAGSTRTFLITFLASQDHPRMRGEHSETSLLRSMAAGSSPHARRAPSGVLQLGMLEGIIPACAGSTPLQKQQ